MSRSRLIFHARLVTTTVAPSVVTYDTSIGNGVDASGFANLNKRSAAKYIFVNSSTGNNANDGLTAATAKATLAGGIAIVTNNAGDQVLAAENTNYTEVPNLNNCSGLNSFFPFVLQTYDPADPTNTAKYGKPTIRPKIGTSATGDQAFTGSVTTPAKYFAVRGMDYHPADQNGNTLTVGGSNGLSNHYALIENNIFAYTMFLCNQDHRDPAQHIIIRGNAGYGSTASVSTTGSTMFLAGIETGSVEENFLYHAGWSISVNNRDAADSAGGANIFRHGIYMQDDSSINVRRNLAIECSATGFSLRGDADVVGNVSIDNPVAFIVGLGNFYQYIRPNGEPLFLTGNAILGNVNLNSTSLRGTAFSTGNGKLGSKARYNLAARGTQTVGVNHLFGMQAAVTSPTSNMDWHDNVGYLWAASGDSIVLEGAQVSADLPTYSGINYYDDPTSGNNHNISALTAPNAYTASALYVALGLTNKATAIARWMAHPEDRPAKSITALLLPGYGIGAMVCEDLMLATNTKVFVGVTTTTLVLGALDGSTLTISGNPSGVTLDSNSRSLTCDGMTTAGSYTLSVTETPTTGSPHTTSLTYVVLAAPTLGTITLSGTLVSGTPSTGTLVGPYGATADSWIEHFGSPPSGLTFDLITNIWPGQPSRTYSYDGTPFAHGSFTLVETLKGATNSPKTSTITF